MKNNHGINISINISVTKILTIRFIVLKLCGKIAWSWVWVLSPFGFGIFLLVLIAVIESLLGG